MSKRLPENEKALAPMLGFSSWRSSYASIAKLSSLEHPNAASIELPIDTPLRIRRVNQYSE
jgi:hypothetical protein